MPNANVHIPAGIISPILVLFMYWLFGNGLPEFGLFDNFCMAILMVVLGVLGAITPDRIEKPTNPHHRGFFHVVVGIIFTGYLILFFADAPALPFLPFTYEDALGIAIISYLSGYASHFILDYAPIRWD